MTEERDIIGEMALAIEIIQTSAIERGISKLTFADFIVELSGLGFTAKEINDHYEAAKRKDDEYANSL